MQNITERNNIMSPQNNQHWYEKAYNGIAGFWNFLDGKKNKIGNAALTVYGVVEAAVQAGVFPEHTLVVKAVLYSGIIFKVLGVSHKAVKGEISLPDGLRNKQKTE
jgi:hypothetical protein